MKEKLSITANIPSDSAQLLYRPLRETYPGSWEDFNAMILYLGMIGSLTLWDDGLDALVSQGEEIPEKGSTERRKLMASILLTFVDEILEKSKDAKSTNAVKDMCEDFRRNL